LKGRVKKFLAPTLRDVANRAHVSTASASRVLNESTTVSLPIRERVEEAVRSLGYTPNKIATSLRRQSTQTVSLLVPDITNPFFADVAKAAARTLRRAGYSCLLCDTEGDIAVEERDATLCLHRRVDGMVVISNNSTAGFFEKLGRQGLAIVLVDRPASRDLDSVRVDNGDGTLQVVAHLAARGQRRLAIISGPLTLLPANERFDAFVTGLDLHNLPRVDDYLHVTGFSIPHGYDAARSLLALDPAPDAIFAGNNTLGIGAIRAIKEAGCRIPEDVAVIMFDDVYLAESLEPPITVIAQPTEQIGTVAAQLLLERLEDPHRQPREVLLRPRLIARGSA
jgi:DNA-binding LacI/PurR family transcriptional regulator